MASPSPLLLALVAAALLLRTPTAAAAPDDHLVTGLPGFHGSFPSNQYSG
jgi:serine carboxypeptidase-like clade 1